MIKDATVYIIDDDPDVRTAIEDLLASSGLRSISFGSPQEFLSGAHPDGPCCLVLDVRLPEGSGLDLQRRLNEGGIRIPIIFITGHGDIPTSVQAMKSGAMEFLTKPFRDDDLLGAVQQALERDRIWRLLHTEIAGLQERYRKLTARERQVMELVVAGLLNKQIADQLGTSEITIKIHRGKVMRKMQAASLPDLVRIAEKLKQETHRNS